MSPLFFSVSYPQGVHVLEVPKEALLHLLVMDQDTYSTDLPLPISAASHFVAWPRCSGLKMLFLTINEFIVASTVARQQSKYSTDACACRLQWGHQWRWSGGHRADRHLQRNPQCADQGESGSHTAGEHSASWVQPSVRVCRHPRPKEPEGRVYKHRVGLQLSGHCPCRFCQSSRLHTGGRLQRSSLGACEELAQLGRSCLQETLVQ